MSVPGSSELLDHMREAVELSLTYVEGWVKGDFLADKRTQQAIIFNLITPNQTRN